MTCPAMMFFSISAVLALLHGQADAVELDLGTRFPAMPNEEIVVRNDGGVRNETHLFAFGETCHQGSLATVTSPPIKRATLRVMASPSPVPPKRCAVVLSARAN
jgi:hypothetical protein